MHRIHFICSVVTFTDDLFTTALIVATRRQTQYCTYYRSWVSGQCGVGVGEGQVVLIGGEGVDYCQGLVTTIPPLLQLAHCQPNSSCDHTDTRGFKVTKSQNKGMKLQTAS